MPPARHLLREVEDILVHRADLGALVDEVSDFRILRIGEQRLWLLLGLRMGIGLLNKAL